MISAINGTDSLTINRRMILSFVLSLTVVSITSTQFASHAFLLGRTNQPKYLCPVLSRTKNKIYASPSIFKKLYYTIDDDKIDLNLSHILNENSSKKRKRQKNPSIFLNIKDADLVKNPLSTRFLRLRQKNFVTNDSRTIELQTAVHTYEKKVKTSSGNLETIQVDLHAQVHFGDENYFSFYNDNENFSSSYDRVHYELMVDESLLYPQLSNGIEQQMNDNLIRTLLMPENGLMPSQADSQTSLQYNLTCQVDAVDYSQPKWIVADVSRQEFQMMQEKEKKRDKLRNKKKFKIQKPKVFLGMEVFDAFLRPTTPASSGSTTQLFSNLFLKGEGIALFFRYLLWTTVPSPELYIMLLDWSSSSPRAGGVSLMAKPVLECLVLGDFQSARKLVFSQMLVSGQLNDGADDLLIGGRNDHAMRVLEYSIKHDECKKNAILYGALHCRDLQNKLLDMGFKRKKIDWRTAWTVDVPDENGKKSKVAAAGALGVPAYLAIGGLDWVAMVEEMTKAFEIGNWSDGFVSIFLYIARHAILYLSLVKFVIEWDTSLYGFGIEGGHIKNTEFGVDKRTKKDKHD